MSKINEQLIQITAARGPAECMWVVAKVLKELLASARSFGLKADVISRQEGNENGTLQSAVVSMTGDSVHAFLQEWEGTVQWVGKSPYRKMHKRKNWFIAVQRIHDTASRFNLEEREIRYEATRSSGPGGQHVNKVSTAIRATHMPTGISVVASDQRSQHMNRQAARKRLAEALQSEKLKEQQSKARENWLDVIEVERGNPVRTFRGTDFKPCHKAAKSRQSRSAEKQQWKLKTEEW